MTSFKYFRRQLPYKLVYVPLRHPPFSDKHYELFSPPQQYLNMYAGDNYARTSKSHNS